MPHQAEVYFIVAGDFEPDTITQELKMSPTDVSKKGDQGRYSKRLAFSSWVLSSGKIMGDHIDVYDLSEKLVNQLNPKATTIAKLVSDLSLSAKLQVVVTLSGSKNAATPSVGFDQKVINFLGEVSACIDVDIYQ